MCFSYASMLDFGFGSLNFQHSNITFVVWFQFFKHFLWFEIFAMKKKTVEKPSRFSTQEQQTISSFGRQESLGVWDNSSYHICRKFPFVSFFSYSQLCRLDRSAELITFPLNRMIMILPSLEWFTWFLHGTRHAVGAQHTLISQRQWSQATKIHSQSSYSLNSLHDEFDKWVDWPKWVEIGSWRCFGMAKCKN